MAGTIFSCIYYLCMWRNRLWHFYWIHHNCQNGQHNLCSCWTTGLVYSWEGSICWFCPLLRGSFNDMIFFVYYYVDAFVHHSPLLTEILCCNLLCGSWCGMTTPHSPIPLNRAKHLLQFWHCTPSMSCLCCSSIFSSRCCFLGWGIFPSSTSPSSLTPWHLLLHSCQNAVFTPCLPAISLFHYHLPLCVRPDFIPTSPTKNFWQVHAGPWMQCLPCPHRGTSLHKRECQFLYCLFHQKALTIWRPLHH